MPKCSECGHELPSPHGIEVDLNSNTVTYLGRSNKLTATQAEFLSVIVWAYPNMVSKERVAGAVWAGEGITNEAMGMQIWLIRRRIKNLAFEIETIWGQGWVLRLKEDY